MNFVGIRYTRIKSKFNTLVLLLLIHSVTSIYAQRGYFDAPYKRYEANLGVLSNGSVSTAKSYSQADLQSEASDQQCVDMSSPNATVEWTILEAADGLVIRYSVPDGQTASVVIYSGDTKLATVTLTSTWSCEYLWNNGNANNTGIVNQNPKMRFDEVHYKLPSPIPISGNLKIVRETGNLHVDFIELEPIPSASIAPIDAVTYTGNGSTLQSFINANGGKKIFIPSGVYNVNTELYFGVSNTTLLGAGMWYTQINFTNTTALNGGLRANATNISFSDLYLTTNSTSRSNSYKAINGVFTSASIIKNIWAEHFECGAWIAQYNIGGPAIAGGFTLSNCRFRNNYADGINLCKGTSNAIVEHCNFRNNGDDDQAIWCANGQECINNTFRFNTSENCWRASGLAIYGGKNNKAYNLIIKDNLESGIRISNNFDGVGFNSLGNHELYNITMISCGTFNDLYNNPVGAIDIFCAGNAGTQIKNVHFSAIDIIDSKNDAILIQKKAGDGIYNLVFQNITVNGTAKEYPFNNKNNSTALRGYFLQFVNAPNGNGTYCNINYSNRGGNATNNENKSGIGSFSWVHDLACVPLGIKKNDNTTITIYPNPVINEFIIGSLNFNDKIAIFDITGKLLLQKTAHSVSETIDTSNYNSGVYFITVNDGITVKKGKFIKQ